MKLIQSVKNWFSGAGGQVETKSHSGVISLDLAARMFRGMGADNALKIEAFYSCIRDKSETIGALPLKLYRVNRGSRELVMQGRNHRIFTQKPNDYMTMQQFLEMIGACLELHGVFYAYIERNDRGEPMSLIPFANQTGVSAQMDVNGVVYYTYATNDGKPVIAASPEDLFIISNFSTNGYRPISPISYQASLLGIAKAQDDHYRALQTEGITAQMALKTEQTFRDANAAQRLSEEFSKSIRGTDGVRGIPILEQGLTPVSLSITPKDAELLGNKQFTVNRICRMTRVPLHRVAEESTGGTKSTASELDEAYMRDAINPILVKVENALNNIIADGYKVEFNRKSFYAGSPWRLVDAVEKELKGGLCSVNEGRIDLGRETIEGGDVFAIDNNNVTYGQWTEIKQIQEQLYGQANNNKPVKQGENDED